MIKREVGTNYPIIYLGDLYIKMNNVDYINLYCKRRKKSNDMVRNMKKRRL